MQVGQHTLKAMVGDEEVCNSPLSLQIVPGAPCLSASVLDESALTSATAGQTCTLTLRACNAFGAPLSRGGAPLTAAFCSDGVFSIACLLRTSGHPDFVYHQLWILAGMQKMPLTLPSEGGTATLHCCPAYTSGCKHSFRRPDAIGQHAQTTAPKVAHGKRKAKSSVLYAAGSWHAAEVADNSDGTYAVSIKPEKSGAFQLVLSMEGSPKGSAHRRVYAGMCIAGVAAAENCAISGVMSQLVAGQPGTLTLTRADRSVTSLLPAAYQTLGVTIAVETVDSTSDQTTSDMSPPLTYSARLLLMCIVIVL